MSGQASEWTNERNRAERASSAEQGNEWTIDSISFQPNVRCLDGRGLHDIRRRKRDPRTIFHEAEPLQN